MKTWHFLVVLAVISVFAVCCLNTIKTSFLRKPFSEKYQLPASDFFQKLSELEPNMNEKRLGEDSFILRVTRAVTWLTVYRSFFIQLGSAIFCEFTRAFILNVNNHVNIKQNISVHSGRFYWSFKCSKYYRKYVIRNFFQIAGSVGKQISVLFEKKNISFDSYSIFSESNTETKKEVTILFWLFYESLER